MNGVPGSTLVLAYANGATLTVGGGSFAGTINDNQNIANLVKNTSGTLYLTGANAYYGSTTVTAGALLYGSMNSVSTVAGHELDHDRDLRGRGAGGERPAQPAALPHQRHGLHRHAGRDPATSADAVNLARILSAISAWARWTARRIPAC